ncbi:MAG: sulfotransferase domain-containing protein [Rubrobacteraceae bacterium]
MKDRVDFLVIGAQKSGTTSLFKYIQNHPQLYVPPQKEVNFFANSDRYSKGLDWYIENFFRGVEEEKLWGEVCPSYMGYSSAPDYIRETCPDVKLVAILRNPIDRAYSHYRMSIRRETETRSFEQVVKELAESPVEAPESKVLDDSPFLLDFGLYGKSLGRYLRHFGRERFLILFQEDLTARPEETLVELFSFLGVDTGYRPPNLGREYHVGGEKRFFGLADRLRERKAVKKAVKSVLRSRRSMEAARFWYEQINIKPVKVAGPSPEERRFLKGVFEEDVALLERLFSVNVPWPEFRGG